MDDQTAAGPALESKAVEQPGDGPSPAAGLSALKEIWAASNRLADLQKEYAFKKAPVIKIFGALLGFGDKPDPLAEVKQRLAEINAKLDRVLEGIQQIQKGLLGLGALNVYLDISDSIFLVERYTEYLPTWLAPTMTDAVRKEFSDKLAGTFSERDGVSFCSYKMMRQTPLLFDTLFAYLSSDAAKSNPRSVYLQGAFLFRFIVDVMVKALLLELFIAADTGDPGQMAARAEKVISRYGLWMRNMIDSKFLPFAESLAMFNFIDEYLGRHDNAYDGQLLIEKWERAENSILESADNLASKLLGRERAVTLRVIPNLPPVAKRVKILPKIVAAGDDYWDFLEITQGKGVPPAETLKWIQEKKPSAFLASALGREGRRDEPRHISAAQIPFPEGARRAIGFEKLPSLSFLRIEFDLGAFPAGAPFYFFHDTNWVAEKFPQLQVMWQRVHVEDRQEYRHEKKSWTYYPMGFAAWTFDLPSEGQLSPVLIMYMYDRFGQRN